MELGHKNPPASARGEQALLSYASPISGSFQVPKVSLVVSNFNGRKFGLIEPTLNSLLEIEYPDFEVIVVDNASTDDSVPFLNASYGSDHRVRIVRNPRNSYSGGLNIGTREAAGKYVVYLNNDLVVERNFVSKLVQALELDSRIALAMGKILSYHDRKTIDRVGDTMDLYGNPVLIGSGEKDAGQFQRIMEILSAAGTANISRKDVVKDLGMFDEDFHIGYEDMDLSLRVHLAGLRVVYVPDARVYHIGAATDSTEELKISVKFHFNKNRISLVLKNYQLGNALKALAGILAIYLVAFCVELWSQGSPKKPLTRITAVIWNLKHLNSLILKRHRVQNQIRRTRDQEFHRLMRKPQLLAGLAYLRKRGF